MAETAPFVVDISSPESIEQAVEQTIQELEEAREGLATARDNVRRWEAIYDRLKLLAGDEDNDGKETIRASTIRVVNERARATKADDVIAALGGNVERKSVNWALWDAARSGEIKKISTGLYVPLTYEGNQIDAILESVTDDTQRLTEETARGTGTVSR
jgi:hypothetical protein